MKVVHDFRATADLLYHQYGLELPYVFDTTASHIMVTNWVVETKVTRAKRLYCLVMYERLDVSDKNEVLSVRNCPYLPALSPILELGSRKDSALKRRIMR